MTICFIGNSHVAALKEGADAFPLPVTYFYAPGQHLRDLVVQDGQLMPAQERSRVMMQSRSEIPGRQVKASVTLADHSAFVVVGFGLSALLAATTYQTHRLWQDEAPGTSMISEAALHDALVAKVRDGAAFRVARLVRAHTERPVLIVAQPAPSESIRDARPRTPLQKSAVKAWRPFIDAGVAGRVLPVYDRAVMSAAAADGVKIVLQDPETMVGAFTRAEFQRESDDLRHGNAEYGRRMMARLHAAVRDDNIGVAAV